MKSKLRLSQIGIAVILVVLLVLLVTTLSQLGGAIATLSSVLGQRQLLPLLLMAVALGTDAMSLCIGIGLRGVDWQDVLRLSLVIGIFHIIMPLIGATAGQYFDQVVGDISHWVGAIIVAYIGGRMIWGCLKEDCATPQLKLTGVSLLILSLGVSIDALSVGFGLGAFGYNILVTALVFGLFGGAMTAIGLLFGCRLGKIIGNRGELVGGFVLIILAMRMLFEG